MPRYESLTNSDWIQQLQRHHHTNLNLFWTFPSADGGKLFLHGKGLCPTVIQKVYPKNKNLVPFCLKPLFIFTHKIRHNQIQRNSSESKLLIIHLRAMHYQSIKSLTPCWGPCRDGSCATTAGTQRRSTPASRATSAATANPTTPAGSHPLSSRSWHQNTPIRLNILINELIKSPIHRFVSVDSSHKMNCI